MPGSAVRFVPPHATGGIAYGALMIVWINGPFGGGKTTTARLLTERIAHTRLFDPEWVGYLLRDHLRDHEVDDFQDLPSWRRLVPIVAAELHHATGDSLVAVQTVLTQQYWNELALGLDLADIPVVHVLLDVDEGTLRHRIDADEVELAAAPWRHDHVPTFLAARDWLTGTADVVIDTSGLDPEHVVDRIVERLSAQ